MDACFALPRAGALRSRPSDEAHRRRHGQPAGMKALPSGFIHGAHGNIDAVPGTTRRTRLALGKSYDHRETGSKFAMPDGFSRNAAGIYCWQGEIRGRSSCAGVGLRRRRWRRSCSINAAAGRHGSRCPRTPRSST